MDISVAEKNPKNFQRKSIIAGLYGNALEWFDFLLYASFAPLFAEIFFPSDLPYVSLLATFGVFAVGFLMRPIGGALLGNYADYAGRRKALILSISIMTIATTLIAFVPSYYYLGITSPILFTLLRLVQGLAVGGELPGSATYLIEHMFAHRRGFAGSLVLCTAFLGIFAGSLTAFLLSAIFSHEFLLQYGWRIAFLTGGLLGMIGILLRIQSVETQKFIQAKPSHELPIKLIFTQYKKQLFFSVLFTSILAMSNYLLIAYVTTFLVKFEGFLLRDALIINLLALLLLTLFIPIMGFLSDIYGRKPIFLIGLISLLILIFPIFFLLMKGSWNAALAAQLILSMVLAPLNATISTMIAEMFPTAVRASGTSIGYNIGQAFFGGTMPLVALTLIDITGNQLAPAWYLFAWALLVIIIANI